MDYSKDDILIEILKDINNILDNNCSKETNLKLVKIKNDLGDYICSIILHIMENESIKKMNRLIENVDKKSKIIFNKVLKERIRQDELHLPFKDNYEAIVVLSEEVGELAQAIYDKRVGKEKDNKHIEEEAIQVMSVCLKFLQGIDNIN